MNKKNWKYLVIAVSLFSPTGFLYLNRSPLLLQQEYRMKKNTQYISADDSDNTLVISNHSEDDLKRKIFRNIEDKITLLEENAYLPEGDDSVVLPKYLAKKSGTVLFGTRLKNKREIT
ncbi:hypothetical protein [Enterococcus larvae]|uniref:hypothetical protein n=1 Tax=Enterococcus larvae TaxID=2794352 RepID=UPI003F3AE00B